MNDTLENFIGRMLVYSNNIDKLTPLLKKLDSNDVDILIEGCSRCMSSLDRCILDTINEYVPDFVLIENNETNNGLTLYEMIKEEGTIDSIPVMILGTKNEAMKLKSLKSGALDYVSDANTEDVYLKILNFISIGKKVMNTSILDRLTGIYTRKYAESIINKSIQSSIENKYPLTLLLIDIDEMKQINSNLGKKTGDEVLKLCVNFIKEFAEEKDIVFRYSGEKFALIFNGKTISKVLEIADNLQLKINTLSENYENKISFSAGISSINTQVTDYYYLMNNAILSLAAAKRDGTSKIYIHDSYTNESKEKNILVVDEEQSISSILVSRYKNKGYKVYRSISAENTLEILNSNIIHMLIIDFKLFTNLIDLKTNFGLSTIKTIVLSSAKNESSLEFAFKNGVDEYIKKPFSIIELDLKVQKLLR